MQNERGDERPSRFPKVVAVVGIVVAALLAVLGVTLGSFAVFTGDILWDVAALSLFVLALALWLGWMAIGVLRDHRSERAP